MADWTPMFTLPNITLTDPIETQDVALVSTADARLSEICSAYPAFRTYVESFKTEFDRSLAPSFVLVHKDAPPSFRGVEALAAFRDSISLSVIPLSWARALRFGSVGHHIHYSNWFAVYPWMLDKNYEYLLSMTMATTAMDEVGRLRGQSSPGISVAPFDHYKIDKPLLDELFVRWQRLYRAQAPLRSDTALFRSLNMANSAAMMPAGVDVTIYDIGRSVSLWVSAFEILSPAKSSAFYSVYENLKKVEYGLTDLKSAIYEAHGFKTTKTKEILPCWVYGELYKARNDFLHGNPIDPDRLTVKPSQRSLFIYAPILYRLALTGFLDLKFEVPLPASDDTAASAAYVNNRMDYRSYQGNIEAGLSTILYTEAEYTAHRRRIPDNLPPPPPPSTDLDEFED
ncbi:hypothetical protein [Bradyrhizobium sp. SZCCHNRI1058]|uniref:hypothetical protein n=1 Tax=Bradyrhizobium sp. SZCCHNRI1058 TaxID=3057279 RepID=UPI002915F358|nr:hypothetical protein [Bradyrhizobium sp. SZCCHNRI1058]